MPEATAMMFFTLGSSCTPRCTACDDDLHRQVDADVVDPGHGARGGDQRLAQRRHLALGGVAQLDVEGNVVAVDAQVAQLRLDTKSRPVWGSTTALQRFGQRGFGHGGHVGGVDGARTRDPRRDRPVF
jgi:hypothetical protein